MQRDHLKSVRLVLVNHVHGPRPFLVSDDELEIGDTACESDLSGQWFVSKIETIADLNLHGRKKVVAGPEQIGFIALSSRTTLEPLRSESQPRVRAMEAKDIDEILQLDGRCAIEMESFEGSYCGFRLIKQHQGKVVIHIGDADRIG